MTRNDDMIADTDDAPPQGGAILVRAILGGVIAGTLANVVALLLGHSIWIGLLCHSLVGALGMGMVLVLSLSKPSSQAQRTSQEPVPVRAESVRH